MLKKYFKKDVKIKSGLTSKNKIIEIIKKIKERKVTGRHRSASFSISQSNINK